MVVREATTGTEIRHDKSCGSVPISTDRSQVTAIAVIVVDSLRVMTIAVEHLSKHVPQQFPIRFVSTRSDDDYLFSLLASGASRQKNGLTNYVSFVHYWMANFTPCCFDKLVARVSPNWGLCAQGSRNFVRWRSSCGCQKSDNSAHLSRICAVIRI